MECRNNGKPSTGSAYGTGKFKGECHYCKKPGLKQPDCWKKKKDDGEQAHASIDKKKKKVKANEDYKMVPMAIEEDDLQVKKRASKPK